MAKTRTHAKLDEATFKQRKVGGMWVKDLRKEAGLTQDALAKLLGIEYFTFISQVETGQTRIPPEKYVDYAIALKQDPREFTKQVLKHWDPHTYHALFEAKGG